MNLQRKVTLLVATGAVALGAGHVVQKRAAERQTAEAVQTETPAAVSAVTPVAAGPDALAPPQFAPPVDLPPVPVMGAAPTQAATSPEPAPVLAAIDSVPDTPPVSMTPSPANDPMAPDCPVQLGLTEQPGGMIGLSLLAPCHPDERIVLYHAGLAITGKTSATGGYFGSLPALRSLADVEVRFSAGDTATAQLAIPAATGLRRFIVQWQDADAFQLHAFQGGASYGEPGHFSAAFTGAPGEGTFVTLLGDSTTDLPLLAEVVSSPAGAAPEIVLEAAVTEATCGREILGETIMAEAGDVEVADLSLAMPACDAIGDILVLKNLVQDMTLAAAK